MTPQAVCDAVDGPRPCAPRSAYDSSPSPEAAVRVLHRLAASGARARPSGPRPGRAGARGRSARSTCRTRSSRPSGRTSSPPAPASGAGTRAPAAARGPVLRVAERCRTPRARARRRRGSTDRRASPCRRTGCRSGTARRCRVERGPAAVAVLHARASRRRARRTTSPSRDAGSCFRSPTTTAAVSSTSGYQLFAYSNAQPPGVPRGL